MLSMAAVALFASAAVADVFTIKGISIGMSRDAVKREVGRRGWSCMIEDRTLSSPGAPVVDEVTCRTGADTSGLPDVELLFSKSGQLFSSIFYCAATSTCGVQVRELERLLRAQGILPSDLGEGEYLYSIGPDASADIVFRDYPGMYIYLHTSLLPEGRGYIYFEDFDRQLGPAPDFQ